MLYKTLQVSNSIGLCHHFVSKYMCLYSFARRNNSFLPISIEELSLKDNEYSVSLCISEMLLNLFSFGYAQLFVIPWTIAHQAPLSMEFQARILEWVAIPFSRGSSQPRHRTWVPCITGRLSPTEPPGQHNLVMCKNLGK